MSSRYLVVARMGEKLRFFSLTSNARPGALKQAVCQMLKTLYGKPPKEFLLISNSKPVPADRNPVDRRYHPSLEVTPPQRTIWWWRGLGPVMK